MSQTLILLFEVPETHPPAKCSSAGLRSRLQGLSKNHVGVSVPTLLDLTQIGDAAAAPDSKFKLTAIIHHTGRLQDGRFFTEAPHPLHNHWLKRDDAEVKLLSALQLSGDTPYIIFYKKVGPTPDAGLPLIAENGRIGRGFDPLEEQEQAVLNTDPAGMPILPFVLPQTVLV